MNRGSAISTGRSWAAARLIWPSSVPIAVMRSRSMPFGPDGADRQLLDAVDWPALERGCSTLVIASGDGCFVDAAYRARQRDIRVVVVSRAESLSAYLASYADVVIEFPEFDPGAPPEFVTAA